MESTQNSFKTFILVNKILESKILHQKLLKQLFSKLILVVVE